MRDKADTIVRRILDLALSLNMPGKARRDAAHDARMAITKNLGGGNRIIVSRTIDSLLAEETDIDSATDTIVSAWLRKTAAAA